MKHVRIRLRFVCLIFSNNFTASLKILNTCEKISYWPSASNNKDLCNGKESNS